jgi:2-dehydro-3-deoxyphosphogluconate aldolase / (4S)-4-hydroxy-2-oxoglutarate aldolase
MADSLVDTLLNSGVVAIFRGDYGGRWLVFVDALLEGGINTMEITLNSPGALAGIREIKAHYGDRIVIGAGTVLSTDQVKEAYQWGAQFIVAPDTDETVIAACHIQNVPVIPGAYTPTEIKRAYRLGAAMVKLFPATDPAYIKAIRAPLDHIPLMATGGVSAENAADFLRAGASVLGIGSSLTRPTLTSDQITDHARRLVSITRSLANQSPTPQPLS